MDCRIVILMYYYFQILQSENVGLGIRQKFNYSFFQSNPVQDCPGFGNQVKLCAKCKYQFDVLKIFPARSLFVSFTFAHNPSVNQPFKVTITTQKGKIASSGDTVSQIRSFNSSRVNFRIDVTVDQNQVMMELEGEECERILNKIEIYYYFVPKQTRLLTEFPASSAPSISKEPLLVDAQCEPNAGYEKKPFMKIYSNGTFELQGSCECNRGFELDGTNCSSG